MTKITKAVFPVAGFGTRFLPVTKAMPKELLPIIDKPLIQYAAEEAIAAGIDTLIFVTGRNKRAIEDHFDSNPELEEALISQGKVEQAKMVQNILPDDVQCIFVRQPKPLGLGHAVLCAQKAVGNNPFALLLADDFVISTKNGVIADLVKAFSKSNNNQLSVVEVDQADVSNYGMIVPDKTSNFVKGLIEKPNPQETPSNLASIGRYILKPEIFKTLALQKASLNSEIQLADAIDVEAKNGFVESVKLEGIRFDCGSVKGYLNAIKYCAQSLDKKHP